MEESSDAGPMIDMNMTPLIDVMLVLIVMLIITIPIQNHMVKLFQPNTTQPPPDVLPFINFVDVDGEGIIYWNGEKMDSILLLEIRMKEVVLKGNIEEVHIRPNKNTLYKPVAKVLAAAQRTGLTKLGIVGNEQFIKDPDLMAP